MTSLHNNFLKEVVYRQMRSSGTHDVEILAKSQSLSLELKNFNFSGSISTLSGCAVGAIMAKKFSMLNKIECVDMCSK